MTLGPQENIILDGALLGKLRADVEDIFQVDRVETPRQAPQGTILFWGDLLRHDSEAAYALIAERWLAHQYTPLLRRREGQIVLIAQPGIVTPKPSNPWINLGLAIVTLISVLFTGAAYECQGCLPATLIEWLAGLPMMLAMMAILLAHEFGHYFAAKYHQVAVTLPYFIPLPIISPVGTLGAFIQLRQPFRTKKQLFDIGIAGPLAGLIFAIPLVLWGIARSPILEIIRDQTILSVSRDQTIRLWDMFTGREFRQFGGHTDNINSAAFNLSGQTIISAGDNPIIRLWDIETGEEIHRFEGHTAKINSVAFSPDGQIIASASDDQTVRIWDPVTGREIQYLQGHTDKVNSVAFSPDGEAIASASDDQTVRIWDPVTGRETDSFKGHIASVRSVAFKPNEQTLRGFLLALLNLDEHIIVTASDDRTVHLWNATTKQDIYHLEGHTAPVNSANFSLDGQTIVSASDDQTILLWDVTTGRKIRRLSGHQSEINLAVFSQVTSVLEGNSVFYLTIKYLIHGQLLPNFAQYSDLSFIQKFLLTLMGIIPDGRGYDIRLSSFAFAAWFGLFVTAMNLLPIGQLDGGHVIYCLLGEKARWLGLALVGVMFVLGIFWWAGWLLWAMLVFFVIGPGHPPPLNDLVPLGWPRMLLAYLMIFIFIIIFMPNPLQPL